MSALPPSSSSSNSIPTSFRLFGKQIELKEREGVEEASQEEKGTFLWKKVLTKSDTNASSRLLLDKFLVSNGIKPFLDRNQAEECETVKGARIRVFDLDTRTEHELQLKLWKSNSYVLAGNWMMDFVKRRNLKQNDEIELYWDEINNKLNFTVSKWNQN